MTDMPRRFNCWLALLALLISTLIAFGEDETRLDLSPAMIVNEADVGDPAGLLDEQRAIIGPPAGAPTKSWSVNSMHNGQYPVSAHIDLGTPKHLASLWLFDTNNKGKMTIEVGEPGKWTVLHTYDCGTYMQWVQFPLNVTSRYVRLTRHDAGANFSEIALYEYTPEAYEKMLAAQKAAAEAAAERARILAKAREEMARQPKVDLGYPIGEAYLVDEVDCGAATPTHDFVESPEGVSVVQTLLGKRCRVLKKTDGEAVYFSYRLGRLKPLLAGENYVLVVEYPEDQPRTITVMCRGNETSRTFHTGSTVGDALHPKYVNNLPESLDLPLSGKFERWQMAFNLHDRYPGVSYIRGEDTRPDTVQDGFVVTIAQFSAANIPLSAGAAVASIKLYVTPGLMDRVPLVKLPPEGLPRRHIFWREEMADGVVQSKDPSKRGLNDPIDWYRYKANQMQLLGINTYTKDLLEFGAVQQWDTTAGGGNKWAYFNGDTKDWWDQIVALMGERGFDILPYYEYSGSKGQQGLGNQRRATPLTRDGDYTHIAWRDKYNADITDPDTYEDFKKILDITIIQNKDKAHFVGAWLRNRGQLPMSFSAATRKRFSEETLFDVERVVTREELKDNPKLLQDYYTWWFGKRRQFLAAMRDHLRQNGVNPDAIMLYTASPSEPGIGLVGMGSYVVTDLPDIWKELAAQPQHKNGDRLLNVLGLDEVVSQHLYLKALKAFSGTWGDWEWQHLAPPSDPQTYKETEGVLISHTFNRLYTVQDPASFEAFRAPAGLAIVRHYSLNENMMFDLHDQPKLGYFCTDVERAGSLCMMAEANAVANGDPTMIGYLHGTSFARGFPEYVRRFNENFLALPALPSVVVPKAASEAHVVVRRLDTKAHGTWLAIVNTDVRPHTKVSIKLPKNGVVTDAATGKVLTAANGSLLLDLYACELRTLHLQ